MQSNRLKQVLTLAVLAPFLIFAARSDAGSDVKVLHLSDESVASVRISLGGTVLSFPMKPTKVILGNKGSFGIDYVENDLAISPLTSNARSHLFVYLYGRRFSFDLSVSGQDGSSVILVRDAEVEPSPLPKIRKPIVRKAK
jgi:hypothetical protein